MSRRKHFEHSEVSNCNCFMGLDIGSVFSSAINAGATNRTNKANMAMNEANIAMQKEINDKNLAFQRENLDYQKQLQQTIFDREDTSYQRTVDDMSSAGLNPLTMNGTNGAGEAIATSPLDAGQAPQNTFAMESPQIDIKTGALNTLLSEFRDMDAHVYTRDSIRSQMENDRVKRAIDLFSHGLKYSDDGHSIVPIDPNMAYDPDKANSQLTLKNREKFGMEDVPNYPAVAGKVVDDVSNFDTEKLKGDILEIWQKVESLFPRASKTDKAKMYEYLLNLKAQADSGAYNPKVILQNMRKAFEIKKKMKQVQKETKKRVRSDKFFNGSKRDYPFNSNGSFVN